MIFGQADPQRMPDEFFTGPAARVVNKSALLKSSAAVKSLCLFSTSDEADRRREGELFTISREHLGSR